MYTVELRVCLRAGKSRSLIDPDPNFRASIEFGQWLWTAPDRVERVTACRFEWIGQFDRSTDRSSGWSGWPPPEARNWFDQFERAWCRTSGRSVSICCQSRTVSDMHLIGYSNLIRPDTLQILGMLSRQPIIFVSGMSLICQ